MIASPAKGMGDAITESFRGGARAWCCSAATGPGPGHDWATLLVGE